MIDPTCTAAEAVKRAISMTNKGGQYLLGTGDYNPIAVPTLCPTCHQSTGGSMVDLPWTNRDGQSGSDCAGFAICYCWKIKRHRPGFAKGFPATLDPSFDDIDDDVNCNSLIEDSVMAQSLCSDRTGTEFPIPGDLLVYPTITLKGPDGQTHHFIGHVGLITYVPGFYRPGRYADLNVAQCHGPNGFKPGVVITDGSIWQHHDTVWPKGNHRTRVIRMKERV